MPRLCDAAACSNHHRLGTPLEEPHPEPQLLRAPRRRARHSLPVRVARVVFWSALFALMAVIALAVVAVGVWVVVVDWQVLGL
jgi:hypothetical protein